MNADNSFQLRIVRVTATGKPGFGRAFLFERWFSGRRRRF
jgi:hypothetical protein